MNIKSTNSKIGVILVLTLVILGIWTMFSSNPQRKVIDDGVVIDGNAFDIEVAKTPAEQMQGLSNRASIPQNRGMLFVYSEPHFPRIWMKDMNFPIDIIWIGSDLTVVDITENISPDTFPATFSPGKPVIYVLEVNAGFVRRNTIDLGDRVVLDKSI